MDDIDKLLPAEYNPRRIGTHDYKALVKSIGEFGDMSGLVFNRRSERIVGGHQRREAYKELGGSIVIDEELSEPSSSGTVAYGHVTIGDERFVYRVVDWPEDKERLANLAANRIQGEWDDDKLAALIYELKDDVNLPDTGFTITEVTELLATVMDIGEDDVDLTPPEKGSEKTKLGDLFQLGDHRLLCGDATVAAAYPELMGKEDAEMVFTDPPYNVDYTGGMGGDGNQHKRPRLLNDRQTATDFYNFLFSVCKNTLQHTRGGVLYLYV